MADELSIALLDLLRKADAGDRAGVVAERRSVILPTPYTRASSCATQPTR